MVPQLVSTSKSPFFSTLRTTEPQRISTPASRPRFPASIAQKRPAAHPPITTTSFFCTLKRFTKRRHKKGSELQGLPPFLYWTWLVSPSSRSGLGPNAFRFPPTTSYSHQALARCKTDE